MNNYYSSLPKKRMGAGALFFNGKNELLIVKPVNKEYWTIPGGVVEIDESPRQACEREIKEEIGLDIKISKLLCVDYILPTEEKDENLQFIFLGGSIDKEFISNISLAENELSEFKFVDIEIAVKEVGTKLSRRIPYCTSVLRNNNCIYLENGQLTGN